MRLNFTCANEEMIREGIARLGRARLVRVGAEFRVCNSVERARLVLDSRYDTTLF